VQLAVQQQNGAEEIIGLVKLSFLRSQWISSGCWVEGKSKWRGPLGGIKALPVCWVLLGSAGTAVYRLMLGFSCDKPLLRRLFRVWFCFKADITEKKKSL